MNFADWPVVDNSEFEFVEIDTVRWDNDGVYTYTPIFNFFKTCGEGDEPNTGYSICSNMSGSTLQELHYKITLLVISGFFVGVPLVSEGTLYDEDHNELESIDWDEYVVATEEEFENVNRVEPVENIPTEIFDMTMLSVEQLKLMSPVPKKIQ